MKKNIFLITAFIMCLALAPGSAFAITAGAGKVKASSGDTSPDFLDGKVDSGVDGTIEVDTNKLRSKVWTRTNSTSLVEPRSANDNLDMGTGTIAGGDLRAVDDTTAAYKLIIDSDSDGTALTADHTLTLDVNNEDHTIDLFENLSIGDGADITLTAEDTAGSITLDEQTFEVEGEGTATQLTKIVNANNAAATITLEGTGSVIDQDVTADAGPQFAGATLTADTSIINTTAPSLIIDNSTTGADADSGYVTLRGNDGAADTELDMSMFLDVTTTTDYKISFMDDGKNTEVASLDQSGDLQIDGTLSVGGAIGSGDITITSTNPIAQFKDSDATAGDVNASIDAQATDVGDGTEDIDVTLKQQVAGSITAFITADADGTLDLGTAAQNTQVVGDLTVTGGDVALGTSSVAGNVAFNDAGVATFYDDGNDTSVAIGPVADGTTTLGLTGGLDVSGAVDANNAVLDGGTNTFSITNGTASLDVAAGATADINQNLTVSGSATTFTNGLTFGATNAGSIDFSAASKTLTIEDDSINNQDTTSDASPTFAGATLSGLNTANGLVQTDGSGVLSTTLTPAGLTSISATTLTDGTASLSGGALTGGTTAVFATKVTTAEIENAAAITIDSTGAGVNITTDNDAGDDFTVGGTKFIVEGDKIQAGIGTSAPDAALEINSATGDNLQLSYNDADGSATYKANIGTTSTGNLSINASGNEVDFNGDYATSLQNFPDVVAGGPGYWLDGVDDKIGLGHSANIDIGTGDYTYQIRVKFADWSATNYLFGQHVDSQNRNRLISSGGNLDRETSQAGVIVSNSDFAYAPGNNVFHDIVWAVEQGETGGDNLYSDGKLVDSANALSANVSIASDLNLGEYATSYSQSEISLFRFFNLALSADEVKAFSNGAPIPYKYIGASQTEQTSGTLTIGKAYRINDWITNDDFTNVGGTNEDGNEFVATGTTPTTWTNSSTVVPIGCALDLEPEGIGHDQWTDTSGNELHGTVSGAINTNLPSKLNLKNTTAEDGDGGRESQIIFAGTQSDGETSTLAQIKASHDATGDDQKGDLILYTNDGSDGNSPTERMRIDSSGNVGIGMTNPESKLHVNSSGTAWDTPIYIEGGIQGGISLFSDGNTNPATTTALGGLTSGPTVEADYLGGFSSYGGNGGLWMRGVSGVGDAPGIVITSLQGVESTSTGCVNFGVYGDNGAGGIQALGNSSMAYSFKNGSTLLIGVLGNGNVGIGTSSPGYLLDVEDDSASDYVANFFNDGNNANRYGIQIQAGADDGSGDTYYINALDGDGTQTGYIWTTSGTFALVDASDQALKENTRDSEISGLDTIKKLKVRDFEWKESGLTRTGFIAQEVYSAYPKACAGTPGAKEDYVKTVPEEVEVDVTYYEEVEEEYQEEVIVYDDVEEEYQEQAAPLAFDENSKVKTVTKTRTVQVPRTELVTKTRTAKVPKTRKETKTVYKQELQQRDKQLGVMKSEIIPVLVKAVQELEAKVALLEARIEALEAK